MTEQKETTKIRSNENSARDDHTGKMTTTEIADIEAWKDDEIINEYGVQFATVWGSSKKASKRQICDNMVLESLDAEVAEALLRGKESIAPEFMSTYFDKIQTDNKLPRTALGMIKIPKDRPDDKWTETVSTSALFSVNPSHTPYCCCPSSA
jgi:hypothetical protein